MNLKIFINRYLFYFLILLYKLGIEISYINIINPLYEYMGFELNINYFKSFESWASTILIVGLISRKTEKSSDLILFFLFIITYIPISSIYWLKDGERIYYLAITLGLILSIIVVKLTPLIHIKNVFIDNKIFYIIVFLASLMSLSVVILFNGIPNLSAFNFNSVYEIRSDFNYGFYFMKYLLTWQVWVINPFLLIHFMTNKNYKLILIPICIQIFIYLSTGHKAYLFSLLVIPILFYTIRRKSFYIIILLGVNFITFISWIEAKYIEMPWVSSLFTNRLLFLPAQISYQYYDFFSENQLVLLTHSIFSKFNNSSYYSLHPIQIIGNQYYGGNWPNTGYFGDAYMNFGIIGIWVFSLLFGLLLVLFDSFTLGKSTKKIVQIMAVLFVIYFTSGGLLTSLLNGGILFFVYLLIIYNRNQLKMI